MNKTSFYEKNKDVIFAELDNEVCLFNPNKAEYLTLNETASLIWNFIDDRKNKKDIVSYLKEKYYVDYEECFSEVSNSLAEMKSLNLINEFEND